jgi:hypothetical protein
MLRTLGFICLLACLLTYSLHGAGHYLKSWQSLSLSKNILLSYGTQRFITMFTKACHWTLSLSQPNPVLPIDPYLSKVQLNVILPPTSRSYQWSLTFGPPNQNPVNTSPLPNASHMSCLSQPPWFNHPNNIWWRIQAMKVIIMQFSPQPVFLPFRSKYPPQHSVLKILSLCSSLKVRHQVSHPYSTIGKITVLYILIFRFFDMRWKDKRFWTE